MFKEESRRAGSKKRWRGERRSRGGTTTFARILPVAQQQHSHLLAPIIVNHLLDVARYLSGSHPKVLADGSVVPCASRWVHLVNIALLNTAALILAIGAHHPPEGKRDHGKQLSREVCVPSNLRVNPEGPPRKPLTALRPSMDMLEKMSSSSSYPWALVGVFRVLDVLRGSRTCVCVWGLRCRGADGVERRGCEWRLVAAIQRIPHPHPHPPQSVSPRRNCPASEGQDSMEASGFGPRMP